MADPGQLQNVLVTGGCGFIPCNFVNHVLKQNNCKVINFDKLCLASNKNYIEPSEKYELVVGDICNRKLVDIVLHKYNIDAIVHFAAQTHVCVSYREPLEFVRTNISGTVTLLEACKSYGKVKRFVYISTDEVYGDTTEEKTETACPAPTNPYSASKMSAECFVDAYRLSYNIPSVVVRMCNIYGPRQSLDKVVPKFITASINGTPFTIQGDGKQKRSWLFVRDSCNAIYTVLLRGNVGAIYNIGSRVEKSVLELAEHIQRNVEMIMERPKGDLNIEYIKDRPYNDKRYQLDATKLMASLGWHPTVAFSDGLKETVQWFIDNRGIKEDRERVLVYGSNGWIGSQFVTLLQSQAVDFVVGKTRPGDDLDSIVENEILEVAPSNVIAFIGRTHGPGNNTIDYLEGGPDKLSINVRDNLYGPMLLAELCRKANVHYTYIGSGCLFTYTDDHPIGSPPFTEEDVPNYFGSSYSVIKGYTDRLMHHYGNVLNIRMRLPVSNQQNSRNLVTKLASYKKIMNVPNSVTVLPELLPIMLNLMRQRHVGTVNLVNPGSIEHTDVLIPYKEMIDPSLDYQLLSLDDSSDFGRGLRSKRSNCYLSTDVLEKLAPGVTPGKEAIIKAIREMSQN